MPAIHYILPGIDARHRAAHGRSGQCGARRDQHAGGGDGIGMGRHHERAAPLPVTRFQRGARCHKARDGGRIVARGVR